MLGAVTEGLGSEELQSSNNASGGKQPGCQEKVEKKCENKLCRPRELKLGHARASAAVLPPQST